MFGAAPAEAATLEVSVFQESLYAEDLFLANGVDDSVPEHLTGSNRVAYASASGRVATAGGALPRAEGELTMTALGNPASGLFGRISARVYYEWRVERIGGDPYTGTVPIDVRTRGGVDSSVNVYAELKELWAQAEIQLPDTGLPDAYHAAVGCSRAGCTLGPVSFDHSFTGHATPDTTYTVVLTVLGSGNLKADTGTFSISGWVDPRIEIAPGFARRDDFRLVFGAGVTPVPLPAPWLLLLSGMLASGLSARRASRAG